MIDIIYLAKYRAEFTQASLTQLLLTVLFHEGAKLIVYTDGDSGGGAEETLRGFPLKGDIAIEAMPEIEIRGEALGGPVAIMNDHLARGGSEVFAKIDNDVIVPPGWLNRCLGVMDGAPELGLLGIEPPESRTAAPWAGGKRMPAPERDWPVYVRTFGGAWPGWAQCDMIGGIGLMRRNAFAGREAMQPHGFNGVGGFSDWQMRHPEVVKGWICPPLKVFLLDRLPMEPWASLSREYIAKGWQRPWTNYSPADAGLWDWWV